MNSSLKLLLAGAALVLGLSTSAVQAATLDVVRDKAGTPVKTMSGDCLRANWADDTEACGKVEPSAPMLMTDIRSIYFGFGKATLTPDAKSMLNVVAASIKMKGAAVTAVRVAGYADRIGSAAANEKLSKKRADAVRDYLASKGIVNAQVVETRWFGDTHPATDCSKKLPKAKLIKCLQPDRRVDVEVESGPFVYTSTNYLDEAETEAPKAVKPAKKAKKAPAKKQ